MEGSIYDMIIRVAIPSLCQLKQSEGWLAGAANSLTIGKDFNPRPKEPRNSFRFWLNLPQSGTGCTGLCLVSSRSHSYNSATSRMGRDRLYRVVSGKMALRFCNSTTHTELTHFYLSFLRERTGAGSGIVAHRHGEKTPTSLSYSEIVFLF